MTNEDMQALVNKAAKIINSGIIISRGATNGDVIKMLFPNVQINAGEVYCKVYTSIPYGDIVGANIDCIKEWWNAPYREENSDG